MSLLRKKSVLPELVVNFLTSQPLSISRNARGVMVLPLKVIEGAKGEMFNVSYEKNELKEQSKTLATKEQLLLDLALENCNQVIVYSLGNDEARNKREGLQATDIDNMLNALKNVFFDTLCFSYELEGADEKIIAFIKKEREYSSIQAVLSVSTAPDHEGIVNVGNGLILNDNTALTAKETTVIVASLLAQARINESLTNKRISRAIDVNPRMTKEEMETAVTNGKFIFTVNRNQVVSVVIDINSLTTIDGKADFYKKNRVIRTLDGIKRDLTEIFNSNIKGKESNNMNGLSKLKSMFISYFRDLEKIEAIQDFNPDDVIVEQGKNKDEVNVSLSISTVDSIEKVYVDITLV